MESEQKSADSPKSKKPAYIFALALVLLLDWAALYDILKGEENTFGEYSMLVISLFVIPLLLFKIFKKV